jgi:hypothetical protein
MDPENRFDNPARLTLISVIRKTNPVYMFIRGHFGIVLHVYKRAFLVLFCMFIRGHFGIVLHVYKRAFLLLFYMYISGHSWYSSTCL